MTFRAAGKPLRIEGAVFNTHTEGAGAYDVDGRPTALRNAIARFNRAMADPRNLRCPEYIAADGTLAESSPMAGSPGVRGRA